MAEAPEDPDPRTPKRGGLWGWWRRTIGKRALVIAGAAGILSHFTAFYIGNHIEPMAPKLILSASKGTVIRYEPEDPEPFEEVVLRPVSRPLRHATYTSCELELRRHNQNARMTSVDVVQTMRDKSMLYRLSYRDPAFQHENWVVPCTVRPGGAASVHF